MNCESGDQKGKSAPSVCSIRCASGELKALIHKKLCPAASVAAKANVWPSGETAICSNGCQFRCRFTPLGKPSESRSVLFDSTLVRDCSQIMASKLAQTRTALTASHNVRRDRE